MAKKKNYLNNKDMLKQIALSHEQDDITAELANMFMLLVERYASKARFAVTDSFKADMKSFALMTLVKVWRSFNSEKSQNPFAYFTQVITHAFYQYQNAERKQRRIKDELLISLEQDPSFAYQVEYEEELRLQHGDNIDFHELHHEIKTVDVEEFAVSNEYEYEYKDGKKTKKS